MSTTEQKLQKIENIILQKANSQADDMIFKAMTCKNESLEEKEIEFLQKKYKEINKETLEIRRKTSQYISNFEIKNKRKLLLKRDDFCNRIFENVFIKLCNFVKTEQYHEWLINKFINLSYNDVSVIDFYVKINDKFAMDLIINKFGQKVNIKEVADIKICGVKIVNNITGLCLDETLDTKLMDQKSWFYTHSHLVFC